MPSPFSPLFHAEEELSFAELQEQLRMPKEDLTRVLHSLACAKYKVLKKVPEGKTIGEADVFAVNSGFTDKMRRIKVIIPDAIAVQIHIEESIIQPQSDI